MSKYIPGNQKHLTLEDRIYIENELNKGTSFKHKKTRTALALFNQICYIKDTKRTTATKWLASKE